MSVKPGRRPHDLSPSSIMGGMAKRERMSSVDIAWLLMDTDHDPMMSVGVMLGEPRDCATFEAGPVAHTRR